MSTNFYIQFSPALDVEMETHVGKRWGSGNGRVSYSFQGASIKTWSEWRELLRGEADWIKLINEYGDLIDVEEFIANVEKSDRSGSIKQGRLHESHGDKNAWIDDDGFSFYAGEYS